MLQTILTTNNIHKINYNTEYRPRHKALEITASVKQNSQIKDIITQQIKHNRGIINITKLKVLYSLDKHFNWLRIKGHIYRQTDEIHVSHNYICTVIHTLSKEVINKAPWVIIM